MTAIPTLLVYFALQRQVHQRTHPRLGQGLSPPLPAGHPPPGGTTHAVILVLRPARTFAESWRPSWPSPRASRRPPRPHTPPPRPVSAHRREGAAHGRQALHGLGPAGACSPRSTPASTRTATTATSPRPTSSSRRTPWPQAEEIRLRVRQHRRRLVARQDLETEFDRYARRRPDPARFPAA